LEVSYDVLGVEPSVSERDLRDLFRKLALELHPAAHEGAARRKALRKFQEIHDAYATIVEHRKGDEEEDEDVTEQLDEEDAYVNVKVVDYLVAGVVSQARLPFGCPSHVKRIGDELLWEIDYSVLKGFPEGSAPYPMPTNDVFDQCKDGSVFSLIWIESDEYCWPVPTPKDAKAQTAFFTPTFLHFEWNLVCKMLPNADSLMQRRVDTALGRLNGDCCVALLDKVIVYSDDGKTHMQDVERVTKKLKKMEMTIDINRSGFGFDWPGLVKILRGESAHANLIKLASDPKPPKVDGEEEPSTSGKEKEGEGEASTSAAGASVSDDLKAAREALKSKEPSKSKGALKIQEGPTPNPNPKSNTKPKGGEAPEEDPKEKKAVKFDLRQRKGKGAAPSVADLPPDVLTKAQSEKSNEELRLEYAIYEQERQRIEEEERAAWKAKGKRDFWDIFESPLFAVFMVQLAFALAYWYFTEYIQRPVEATFEPVKPLRWKTVPFPQQ